MAARRKRKTKTKQTLNEFQAWLQGVEELQPENWSPNREQWTLIRAKIDGIIVEELQQPPVQNITNVQPAQPVQPPPQTVPGIMPPPAVGGFPAGAVAMAPAAKRMLDPNERKTPDIDTSDGNVTSSFE